MVKPFNGDFKVTQIFGVNPQNYVQFGLQGHNGIDYALPTGTKVLAPHGGKIIEATLDPAGYGLYIKIENDIEGKVQFIQLKDIDEYYMINYDSLLKTNKPNIKQTQLLEKEFLLYLLKKTKELRLAYMQLQ